MTTTADPLSSVVDAPLFIVPRVLDALRACRERPRPASPAATQLDALLDRLLAGVAAHPTRFWVMKQFQKTLEQVGDAPAERARLDAELEKLMAILGIPSADDVLRTWRN